MLRPFPHGNSDFRQEMALSTDLEADGHPPSPLKLTTGSSPSIANIILCRDTPDGQSVGLKHTFRNIWIFFNVP